MTNRVCNLLVGATYLPLMDRITPAGAFGFHVGLCLLGYTFVLVCFPETAGLSLEKVQLILRSRFGIRESERLRGQKRALLSAEKEPRQGSATLDGGGVSAPEPSPR
ncbi:hypothetical protein PYCCODRAFT_1459156 [Trametes coccinea BRFM310]|uniref:Major facilitator superfamily (MFS) profile domain-containing protein n=1 Tax=Trametes coccinea (strain BRFM310) TaxID=1353009 RepID=A0A1Y2IM68_TRAC3|nr:hypothetical protein PYCCODRAFT_1459156 [Trametes coccinea BRFM310]